MKKNYLIYWKYHLESRLYMFRKLTLYLFLLLASIGLTYDTQSYTSGALSGSAYGIIGLSTLIALCYILPGIFLVRYLGKRWQVKPLVLVFALIGGVFITGWIAGYANTISHDWVTAHLSSKSFFYRFEDALMAPLVEEPLKLAAFLFAIYMVPTNSYKGLLLVAITEVLASRLVKTSPISFQICLMVFLIRFRESLVELLVLYRLTGFTRPSLLWG